MITSIPSFLITCLIIELTPGPNMAYLAILTADRGRKAGLQAMVGIALGLFAIGILVSLGMGSLLATSRVLYEGLRWAGFLYLLYLAYEAWGATSATTEKARKSRYFVRGFLTNLFNPKAALFYATVFPAFIQENAPPFRAWALLCVLYVGIATSIHAAIVLSAGTTQKLLAASESDTRIRKLFSLSLVAVAFWILFSTKK